MSFNRCFLLSISCLLVFVAGCKPSNSDGETTSNGSKAELQKKVIAVSYPLEYLTQSLLGSDFKVSCPATQASDPTAWRPKRDDIVKMQSADLIIANGTGADYAKWLVSVSLPETKLRFAATRGVKLTDFIAVEDVRVVHSHGPEGEHSHPTMVSRTWLSPVMAKKQVEYLANELSNTYSEQEQEIESALSVVLERLGKIEQKAKSFGSEISVVTATPELKFFTRAMQAKDFHLNIESNTTSQLFGKNLNDLLKDATNRPSVILVPKHLKAWLTDAVKAEMQKEKLSPVVVDLLDHPTKADWIDRLDAEFDRVGKAIQMDR